MGDNYNRDQYGHRPSSANQYAPPQGYQPQYAGRQNEGYSPYSSTTNFQPQPQGYNTYQPPRDEGYRPPRLDQIDPYRGGGDRGDYDDRRGHEHHHHHNGSYPPPPGYGEHQGSRRSSRSGREKHGHEAEKSVGATLLGGAVGAFAGHEIGHGGLSTLLGAAAGAYGGHELEKKREKKKRDKERRESGSRDLDGYEERKSSQSRRRSRSNRRRDSSSSSSGSNDSRRRRPSHGRYN